MQASYCKTLLPSKRHNAKAAKLFLQKIMKQNKNCCPSVFNTDKSLTYRNNRLESDHEKLKQVSNPMLSFTSRKTAYATIKGIEMMHMFRKGQFNCWMYGNRHEIIFIN